MTNHFPTSPTQGSEDLPLTMTKADRHALDVRGVTVELGGNQVLHSVSFVAPAGRLALLTGRSGAGKSTLLNGVAGLLAISAGSVRLGEVDLTAGSPTLRRRIGIVYQDPLLLTDLSVLDNVLWVARLRGLSGAAARDRSLFALEMVGVDDLAARKVHHLSGGEAQRVSVARAIVGDPLLVIADEPTSALDSSNSEAVGELLSHLARRMSCPVLVASHDPILSTHADVVFEISDGVIREVSS